MLRRLLFALLLAGLPLVAAAALGSASPLLDLANLAIVPVASITAIAGLALAFMARRWWKKTVYAAAGLASLVMLWPPDSPPSLCGAGAARVRVAWLNAAGSNVPAPILAWLDAEQPDMVAFGELGNGAHAVRAAVAEGYPASQLCHASGNCGTIIYSRRQPLRSEPLSRGDAQNREDLSAARMTFALEGDARLSLMAVHLSRPLPLGRQRAELERLALTLENPADTVILGDFNATRRMHTLRDFTRNWGFTASAAGPTWPLKWDGRATPPFIQIDQVLVGRNWAVDSLRVARGLGSDHAGLVADLCRRL